MEAALVAPVFFLLLFGIIEFGFLFKDRLTTDNAAREGARAASVVGDDADSDFVILQSIGHGLNTMARSQISKVIIYRASTPDDPVPSSCVASGSQAGPAVFCNSYSGSDIDELLYDTNGDPNDFYGCVAGTSADRFWCPTSRDSDLSGTPPDYVGVYVETTHGFITGLFGDGTTLSQTAVNRIEPSS